MREMKLQELKTKSPAELVSFAEELEVENASTMRKQEQMFAILKQLAAKEIDIIGEGVVEVLPDGFGFLRSADGSYLAGPLYDEEGILYAELDPDLLLQSRQRFDPAGHYHRPDVLKLEVRPN